MVLLFDHHSQYRKFQFSTEPTIKVIFILIKKIIKDTARCNQNIYSKKCQITSFWHNLCMSLLTKLYDPLIHTRDRTTSRGEEVMKAHLAFYKFLCWLYSGFTERSFEFCANVSSNFNVWWFFCNLKMIFNSLLIIINQYLTSLALFYQTSTQDAFMDHSVLLQSKPEHQDHQIFKWSLIIINHYLASLAMFYQRSTQDDIGYSFVDHSVLLQSKPEHQDHQIFKWSLIIINHYLASLAMFYQRSTKMILGTASWIVLFCYSVNLNIKIIRYL